MSDVLLKKVTYGQLKKNDWLEEDDPYGLAAFVDENIRSTFLECPNNVANEKTACLFAVENGNVVGRFLLYGTSIKSATSIIAAQSFGSIEVDISQRGKGVGTKMNQWTLGNDEYELFVFSLISAQCFSLMRKKENECTIFDFPRFVKIINTEPVFARKLSGFPLRICKGLGNVAIGLLNVPNKIRVRRLKKTYKVERLSQVPDWAGEMCLNDGHKFAEYHDQTWLQWNLTHNLSMKPEDIQAFYAILREDKPVGFFFTKERLKENEGGYKRMLCGTVCEWATTDPGLTEADINLLSVETFSRECFHVLTVTDSPTSEKCLRRFGFIPHGRMQMGFKDKLHLYPDMSDQSLWRIRYGCCNSILY